MQHRIDTIFHSAKPPGTGNSHPAQFSALSGAPRNLSVTQEMLFFCLYGTSVRLNAISWAGSGPSEEPNTTAALARGQPSPGASARRQGGSEVAHEALGAPVSISLKCLFSCSDRLVFKVFFLQKTWLSQWSADFLLRGELRHTGCWGDLQHRGQSGACEGSWGSAEAATPRAVGVHSPARGVCKTTPQGVWVGEEEQSQLWSLIQKAGYPGLGPSFA